MKEKELLEKIANAAIGSEGLSTALGSIQALIAHHCGAALLIIRPEKSGGAISASPEVCEFLESRQFPYRGLYLAPVRSLNGRLGMLVACIGTWGMSAELLGRIANFAAQQLTELACRLELGAIDYAEAA